MSEPQLERSVLEAKEREELYAIAEALGTKPGSRARKSDLILQILRATGVTVDEAEPETPAEKPRRTRTRKVASPPIEVAPSETVTHGAATQAAQGATQGAKGEGEDAPPENGAGGLAAVGTLFPNDGSNDSNDSNDDDVDDDDGGDLDRRAAAAVEIARAALHHSDDLDTTANNGAVNNGSSANGRGDDDAGRTHPGSAPPGQSSGIASGQAQQGRFDGDAANRRNRRRRGRERTAEPRGAAPSDRELQTQPGEIAYSGDPVPVKGYLDLRDEGYGFLRTKGYIASPNDVYVSISQVRRFALRKGDEIDGACRPASSSEKYPAMLRIDTVCGLAPEDARMRPKFEDLTPLFPDEKMRLEVPGDPANLTARIVDLISPIGKGQRGLIVSPPKAGKTTVLKQIAHSIEANNPEVVLMVLLVDERPEEVTDMRRSVKGEVIASTFDRPADEHTHVAELTIERAKRLVELGRDVVIVLDGITRLARAYNLAQPATGRVMSGGIDTGALYPPKKFFGSARNIEEGGSLTILATALVETGSRMDEVIFEEFKGTGNMELRLDRKLAERRIYPALDVNASSTRHEELLFDRQQLQQVWKLRRVLNALGADGSDAAALQLLMDKIKTTKSNDEFLAEIAKTPAPSI